MGFITAAAIKRRSVTLLAVAIVLVAGVFTYNSLRVELFPEIDFPLVVVTTSYPSADPQGVVQDVTAPIESAILGTPALETLQSTSFEGNSIVLATFVYGTDMANTESNIEVALNALSFPRGVEEPEVGRFSPDQIPVIQFSVLSEQGPEVAAPLVASEILPRLEEIDGVLQVRASGEIQRQVLVSVDPSALESRGLTLAQVTRTLEDNNLSLPTGLVFEAGRALPVRSGHLLTSVEDIRNLAVGPDTRLGDVAQVSLTEGAPSSISRTNGQPSIGVSVLKEAEANTIEVTEAVRAVLDSITNLPPGVEFVIVQDDGPQVQEQIDTLQNEAIYGFLFAVAVVFLFMLTLRPNAWKGLLTTVRPTIVIGLAIPLSILAGVLLMGWQGMTLNFMTLGGLAISVGRVVDDAIVVLENVYRHIQAGKERWRAALDATVEVGPAIFASTLTTIVVFLPLAFIEGLVGAFFLPFAMTVSFALVASLAVALTAVPVLGAYLLRPGDLPEGAGEDDVTFVHETWMQRLYTPILHWALAHRLRTLAGAAAVTLASLALVWFIPINLFPSGDNRYVEIEVALPPGAPLEQTLVEVIEIENRVHDVSEIYTVSIGATDLASGGTPGGFNQASILLVLNDNAPDNLAQTLRDELPTPGRTVRIRELANGPPVSGIEIVISGPNYDQIQVVSQQLIASLSTVEGVVNLESDVAQSRDEVAIRVDPDSASAIGLSARGVSAQLNQLMVGRSVTSINVDGDDVDVVVAGDRQALNGIEAMKSIVITGPAGAAPLGELAQISRRQGPVNISRTDGRRSASITGEIASDDTQRVGVEIDSLIDNLNLPPGVEVLSGGIFADIAEGFQAIFISMAVGIILMYLVMAASLGSLKNPIVIITSLPLALIGVLVSLTVTGRSLGLPAMMGILLLIGIVVTNAIVLIAFVEQLRARGMPVMEALINGGRVRLRPILMTAMTTSFALLPLAAFAGNQDGLISAELATVVIGGLISSTGLTLIVVPIVYYLFNVSIPGFFGGLFRRSSQS